MDLRTVAIADIKIGNRYRKDAGHTLDLQKSITDVGLLHPIVLNSRLELIAGFRRMSAVKQLGWTEVPCVVAASLDEAVAALKAELGENTCRLNMAPVEIYELGKAIEAIEKPDAKRRQKDHGGTAPGKPSNTPGNLPGVKKGDTRDKVASSLGISGRTYEKIKQVVEAAEKEPEKFGDLPDRMSQQSVDAAHKELRRREEPPTPPSWEAVLHRIEMGYFQLLDATPSAPVPDDERLKMLVRVRSRLDALIASLEQK